MRASYRLKLVNIDPYLTTIETVAAPILGSYRLVPIDIDERLWAAEARLCSLSQILAAPFAAYSISHYINIALYHHHRQSSALIDLLGLDVGEAARLAGRIAGRGYLFISYNHELNKSISISIDIFITVMPAKSCRSISGNAAQSRLRDAGQSAGRVDGAGASGCRALASAALSRPPTARAPQSVDARMRRDPHACVREGGAAAGRLRPPFGYLLLNYYCGVRPAHAACAASAPACLTALHPCARPLV